MSETFHKDRYRSFRQSSVVKRECIDIGTSLERLHHEAQSREIHRKISELDGRRGLRGRGSEQWVGGIIGYLFWSA